LLTGKKMYDGDLDGAAADEAPRRAAAVAVKDPTM